jgi:hypothetical protein
MVAFQETVQLFHDGGILSRVLFGLDFRNQLGRSASHLAHCLAHRHVTQFLGMLVQRGLQFRQRLGKVGIVRSCGLSTKSTNSVIETAMGFHKDYIALSWTVTQYRYLCM